MTMQKKKKNGRNTRRERERERFVEIEDTSFPCNASSLL